MKLAILALLALTACTTAPPLVKLSGTPAPPRYAVAGDGPAAAEVQRQLTARGLYAAAASTVIRTGYAVAPRASTACLEVDAAAKAGCKTWHDAPASGLALFAPPLRHHLVLVVEGATNARIDVTQPGDRTVALPALVSAGLAKLPAAAR